MPRSPPWRSAQPRLCGYTVHRDTSKGVDHASPNRLELGGRPVCGADRKLLHSDQLLLSLAVTLIAISLLYNDNRSIVPGHPLRVVFRIAEGTDGRRAQSYPTLPVRRVVLQREQIRPPITCSSPATRSTIP